MAGVRSMDNQHVQNITYWFREWREWKRLSQRQLAELMGLTKATVSRIENGDRAFTQSYLEDFHRVIGCALVDPLVRAPDGHDGVFEPLNRDEFKALKEGLGDVIKHRAAAIRKHLRERREEQQNGSRPKRKSTDHR